MGRSALALLFAALVIAAEPGPRVEMAATPAQVAVGDSLAVTVTYRWPRGWSVATEPDPTLAFRDLYVTAAPLPERSSTGEEERRTFRYTVSAVRSGAWALPRPAFKATGKAGPVEAKAPEVIVQVGTEAKPAQLPPPRALMIRPPPSAVAANRGWLWVVAGTLVVAAGIFWWWWRQRRLADSGPTPWEIFIRELATARQASDGRDVGMRISLAMRRFAGSTGGFDGPGQTTREVGATLRRLPAGRFSDDEGSELMRVLGRLDDLRWNAGEVPAATMLDLVTVASAWAEGVRKRLDAEAAARAAAGGTAGATA